MAQFERHTHPARARLVEVSRHGRWAFDAIDDRRTRGIDWPASVYCPLDALADVLPDALVRAVGPAAMAELYRQGPLGLARVIDPLSTMAAWRMTQGIYRVDPAVYDAVVETPLEGEIPAHALEALPEWCVYVETPGLRTPRPDGGGEVDVLGAWARQDIAPVHGRVLAVALNVVGDDAMAHQHLPLSGTVDAGVRAIFSEWGAAPAGAVDAVLSYLRPILNLLLYIASSNDFSRRGQAAMPANPEPKRLGSRGWRLFPAAGPVVWDVGTRMGAALRAAYAREETGGDAAPTGRHVRPHVRRAHWHTIVSGPRVRDDGAPINAADRRRELRWMPPIPVNVDDVDDLPATVRPVR